MPVRDLKDPVLAEVMAFLRAETTTRRLWRKRAWLGRRAAFARVEAVVLERYQASVRSNDEGRHAFVQRLLQALEDIGALDIVSAGRWAEEELEDPTEGTRPVEVWGGQPTPVTTAAWVAALNGRPKNRVR